jgi:hypothetical protein
MSKPFPLNLSRCLTPFENAPSDVDLCTSSRAAKYFLIFPCNWHDPEPISQSFSREIYNLAAFCLDLRRRPSFANIFRRDAETQRTHVVPCVSVPLHSCVHGPGGNLKFIHFARAPLPGGGAMATSI